MYRGPCNCSKLIMTSNNPATLAKHGGELGQYSLVGGMAGRPVYRCGQITWRTGTIMGSVHLHCTGTYVQYKCGR